MHARRGAVPFRVRGTPIGTRGAGDADACWRRRSPLAEATRAPSRPTLNWYNFPDDSGALQQAADQCSQASGGRYRISYNKLPRAADGQRQQLVRRLAAEDDSMDILGLDVTWAAEFAEAGLDPAMDRGGQARRPPRAPCASRCRPPPGRASCTPSRTTPTPSSCGTAATWCPPRPRPGRDAGHGPRPRQAGQAALRGDPGRPVRGPDGLVQHPGQQRGRLHPQPDGPPTLARPARRPGRRRSCTTWRTPRPRTPPCPTRWRTRTGWPWSRERRPSS